MFLCFYVLHKNDRKPYIDQYSQRILSLCWRTMAPFWKFFISSSPLNLNVKTTFCRFRFCAAFTTAVRLVQYKLLAGHNLVRYLFHSPGCAVALSSCSSHQAKGLICLQIGLVPPGSGTKAPLCRKFLQFPPSCVTNALLCLSPKPQPHGTQFSPGIFPLTETH